MNAELEKYITKLKVKNAAKTCTNAGIIGTALFGAAYGLTKILSPYDTFSSEDALTLSSLTLSMTALYTSIFLGLKTAENNHKRNYKF